MCKKDRKRFVGRLDPRLDFFEWTFRWSKLINRLQSEPAQPDTDAFLNLAQLEEEVAHFPQKLKSMAISMDG